MAKNDEDQILEHLNEIVNGVEAVDLPPELLARVRDADRQLREEQSLLRSLRKKLSDSLGAVPPADEPLPSFALEGSEEDDDEDPIDDLLADEE